MPWRRCKRPELGAALVAVLLLAGACAPAVDPPPVAVEPDPEAAFLVDPLLGYPLGVSVDERLRLAQAHAALVTRRQASAATVEANALLERNSELHPAHLVLAQVDLAQGNHREALERARRLVDAVGDYFGARLLQARAAEKVGDVILAYDGYFELSERSEVARGRAAELRPRTLDIAAKRAADALRRNRIDEASDAVKRLAKWAPGEAVTLFAARDLAAAVGDREAELVAVRRLEPRFPDDLALRDARAGGAGSSWRGSPPAPVGAGPAARGGAPARSPGRIPSSARCSDPGPSRPSRRSR